MGRLREGEGKEEGNLLFFFFGRFMGVWEQWRDGFSIGIVSDLVKRKKRKRIN